jgi:hypothetical protein
MKTLKIGSISQYRIKRYGMDGLYCPLIPSNPVADYYSENPSNNLSQEGRKHSYICRFFTNEA